MDLGIKDRHAIVCASSRGLGKACAAALAREGCHVVINGRDEGTLQEAADDIRRSGGGSVTPIAADINTPAGRARLLAACEAPDILVNNNAGPPPGNFAAWGTDDWQSALDANLLAPAFMIQAVLEGMKARRFGRIVNITSAMVKSPRAAMGLSTAARSGLTALCKGLANDCAAFNVTINNLLPERFDTDRQKFMAGLMMRSQGLTLEEARQAIANTINARRFGQPEEFGDACAFLCSAQAGYISGQNLQLDGGTYSGLI
ncbi:MAG: SDR family oxidoreductase [Pseudomonadales bacterium]|nr:SDR family oxidoreductase [Pseudomonadales bacterium]